MTPEQYQQTHNVSGSLTDHFQRMMGLAHAGALSHEAMVGFERTITDQIRAAEILALDTPKGNRNFDLARKILGYSDTDVNQAVLAFPKPKPVLPASPSKFGGIHG